MTRYVGLWYHYSFISHKSIFYIPCDIYLQDVVGDVQLSLLHSFLV